MRRLPSCALALMVCFLAMPWAAAQESKAPFSRRNPIVEAVDKTKSAVVLVRVPRPNGGKDMIGTGVIISECGYIITNRHVIGPAERATVALRDGRETAAQVVVGDNRYDLALLKIRSPKSLAILKPASTDDLLVGEQVIAVGNPLGYSNTVSTGIISALEREITMPTGEVLRGLIQTDASINPGNSGGPLLNINGEFIGINVALRQDAQGIAFTISARTVDQFLKEHLGAAKMAGVAHGLKCHVKALAETGADRQRIVVNQVTDQPNVQQGDEILSVADRPVATMFDVERALWDKRPGQRVHLKVVRRGRERIVTLTLAASIGAGTTTTPAALPVPPAVVPGRVSPGGDR